MKKSMASHAGVAIITSIVGAMFVEYLRPTFPSFYRILENIGHWFAINLFRIFGVNVDPIYFIPMFVTLLLAVIWGWAYGMARHRNND